MPNLQIKITSYLQEELELEFNGTHELLIHADDFDKVFSGYQPR
jgi:hypothetical protein